MKLKALIEKRNSLIDEAEGLLQAAETETRAMSAEEKEKFDGLQAEIRALGETIAAAEQAEEQERSAAVPADEDTAAKEDRAFADYVLGRESRAGEQNMTMGNNGAIIPSTIANRIIKAVRDRCPILARATRYNVKGALKIPVWGKAGGTHDIAVGYHTEFTELTADTGKFTSVDLGGFLAGSLVLIGRSLENNGSFSVTSFIVDQMAEEIAFFLEKELLTGAGANAAQGILNAENVKTAAAAAAITADELIELQASVKTAYQPNACFIMHPDTFTAIKKLKDGNNRYLLQDDITGDFPYRLLGKPVFLSDNMPKLAAGNAAVFYGDCSGLAVNFREDISLEILREKYATQHAVGVVAWFEFDARIMDNQRLAVLKMKAAG